MIIIELHLPSTSILATAVALLAIAPAALALILCVHFYSPFPSLQIPSGLLGGFLILSVICCIGLGGFPRSRPAAGVVITTGVVSFAIGVYWLAERLYIEQHGVRSKLHVAIEVALAALWTAQLIALSCLSTLALCGVYSDCQSLEDHQQFVTPTELTQKSGIYGNAVDKEIASPNPSTSSWPETLVVRQTPQEPPRSPKKFTLKRSPTKKSTNGHHSPQNTHQQASQQAIVTGHQMPLTMLNVDGLAVPSGVIDLENPSSTVPWVPNNFKWSLSESQSRSVSGSSQASRGTSIFAATDYNRRLNEAGFQKDEPIPIPKLRGKQSFSEYDLERIHQMSQVKLNVT